MPQNRSDDLDSKLLYEVDESPPTTLTLGLGLQSALLFLSAVILMPTIAYQAAGASESVAAWAVFASLVTAGIVSVLQAYPIRRFGAGLFMATCPTAAALAVTVDALSAGGPSLLLALLVATALFQFVLSYRISMFRRIITQTVSGVILILVPVTAAPIMFQRIGEVSSGNSAPVGLVCALVTLAAIVFVSLYGRPRLRPWAPLLGIGAGGAVAGAYGLIDVDQLRQAPWVGLPSTAWPTFELHLGSSFWALLPAFLIVAVSCSIRTISATLAVQDVSWRSPRAPDMRAVQGSLAAEAFSNLLAGLGGTMMHATRSATASLIGSTLVSARSVGLVLGFALVAIAFLPKVAALILALPPSVLAAYLAVMLVTLFVTGMKLIVSAGLDYRRTLIIGFSFWIGVGCEYALFVPDLLPEIAGGFLDNGLATGGLTAILMTVLLELAVRRRRRLVTDLSESCFPELRAFVAQFGSDSGCSRKMLHRLEAVAEETFLILIEDQSASGAGTRRLWVNAHSESGDAILEFVARSGEGNIEDRIAFLGDASEARPADRDISLHLLRHLASEVRHRQYHDIDFITVRVEDAKSSAML